MSYGGSSGGGGKISTASDTALSNVTDNDVLTYNATTQKWTNAQQAAAVPATSVSAGTVRLAGDLAGTASSPSLAPIGSGGTVGSASAVPVITYDTKGRITAASTVTVAAGGGSGDTYVANGQTGSAYTLVSSDAGKIIENTAATALTVTVPANASVAFPIGTTIEFLNYSTGSITLTGGGSSGGSGGTTTASESFAGTTGAGWSNQWSAVPLSGSSASATIQSNAGRLATGTTAYAALRMYLAAMAAQADTDLSFVFTVGAQTNTAIWISLSADNTIATNQTNLSQNCYAVNLSVNPTASSGSFTTYSIVNNGTPTTLGTGALTLTAGTTYGFRFQRTGTTVRFRVWDNSGAEPGAWNYSGTDSGTQPAAGRVSLAFGNSNDTTSRYVDFDNVVVATPGSGGAGTVALRSVAGLRLTGQYAPAAIRKRATDEWIVTGATVV